MEHPMKLNHLNLVVPDLDAAQELFTATFGFDLLLRRGDALAALVGEDGFTLVLADSRRSGGDGVPRYPETFHVGFLQETRAAVDALHASLAAAPVELGHAPRLMHGSYGFYFTALGGILFEISTWVGAGGGTTE
jgi:catechol 2,3-dioxygenase-like lactoylglutathione lyase family enzyme